MQTISKIFKFFGIALQLLKSMYGMTNYGKLSAYEVT